MRADFNGLLKRTEPLSDGDWFALIEARLALLKAALEYVPPPLVGAFRPTNEKSLGARIWINGLHEDEVPDDLRKLLARRGFFGTVNRPRFDSAEGVMRTWGLLLVDGELKWHVLSIAYRHGGPSYTLYYTGITLNEFVPAPGGSAAAEILRELDRSLGLTWYYLGECIVDASKQFSQRAAALRDCADIVKMEEAMAVGL